MKAILLALAILGGVTDRPVVEQYRIDLVVSEFDPTAPLSGQTAKVIAEPVVVTQSGRPAYFGTGNIVAQPTEINGPGVGRLRSGLEVEVTPIGIADGRVGTEVRGEWVGAVRPVRFAAKFAGTTKHRVRVETGDPGKVVWVDVTVTPVAPYDER